MTKLQRLEKQIKDGYGVITLREGNDLFFQYVEEALKQMRKLRNQ
jgi:hypothetical protein